MRTLVITEEDMKGPKIKGNDIDLYSWRDQETLRLNLSDYDGIILDVTSAYSPATALRESVKEFMRQVLTYSEYITDVLKKNNSFIAIVGDPSFSCGNGLNMLDLFGINATVDRGDGKSIVHLEKPQEALTPYLQKISSYNFVVRAENISTNRSALPKLFPNYYDAGYLFRPLVKTRAGHYVAIDFYGEHEEDEENQRFKGHLYLLPKVEDGGIKLLLNLLLHGDSEQAEPGWANKIAVAGQEALDQKILAIKAKMCEEKQRLDKLVEKRNALRQDIRILWQVGHALEKSVQETLRNMGFTLSDTDENGSVDVCMSYKRMHFVIEIKSTNKQQISKDGLRQVIEWQNDKETEDSSTVYKPILIISNEVAKSSSERSEDFLPNNLEDFVKRKGIVLISVNTLFKVAEGIRSGEIRLDDFASSLYSHASKYLLSDLLNFANN